MRLLTPTHKNGPVLKLIVLDIIQAGTRTHRCQFREKNLRQMSILDNIFLIRARLINSVQIQFILQIKMSKALLFKPLVISGTAKASNHYITMVLTTLLGYRTKRVPPTVFKLETQELSGASFQTNKSLSLHNKCKTMKEYSLSDNGTLKNKMSTSVRTTIRTLMLLVQSNAVAAGWLRSYSRHSLWR